MPDNDYSNWKNKWKKLDNHIKNPPKHFTALADIKNVSANTICVNRRGGAQQYDGC